MMMDLHRSSIKKRGRHRPRKKSASKRRSLLAALAAIRKYQNPGFNPQPPPLLQDPHVFTPPQLPQNQEMRRERWPPNHQNNHQNSYNGHGRGAKQYRERRSHLDDVYFPNYEDTEDLELQTETFYESPSYQHHYTPYTNGYGRNPPNWQSHHNFNRPYTYHRNSTRRSGASRNSAINEPGAKESDTKPSEKPGNSKSFSKAPPKTDSANARDNVKTEIKCAKKCSDAFNVVKDVAKASVIKNTAFPESADKKTPPKSEEKIPEANQTRAQFDWLAVEHRSSVDSDEETICLDENFITIDQINTSMSFMVRPASTLITVKTDQTETSKETSLLNDGSMKKDDDEDCTQKCPPIEFVGVKTETLSDDMSTKTETGDNLLVISKESVSLQELTEVDVKESEDIVKSELQKPVDSLPASSNSSDKEKLKEDTLMKDANSIVSKCTKSGKLGEVDNEESSPKVGAISMESKNNPLPPIKMCESKSGKEGITNVQPNSKINNKPNLKSDDIEKSLARTTQKMSTVSKEVGIIEMDVDEHRDTIFNNKTIKTACKNIECNVTGANNKPLVTDVEKSNSNKTTPPKPSSKRLLMDSELVIKMKRLKEDVAAISNKISTKRALSVSEERNAKIAIFDNSSDCLLQEIDAFIGEESSTNYKKHPKISKRSRSLSLTGSKHDNTPKLRKWASLDSVDPHAVTLLREFDLRDKLLEYLADKDDSNIFKSLLMSHRSDITPEPKKQREEEKECGDSNNLELVQNQNESRKESNVKVQNKKDNTELKTKNESTKNKLDNSPQEEDGSRGCQNKDESLNSELVPNQNEVIQELKFKSDPVQYKTVNAELKGKSTKRKTENSSQDHKNKSETTENKFENSSKDGLAQEKVLRGFSECKSKVESPQNNISNDGTSKPALAQDKVVRGLSECKSMAESAHTQTEVSLKESKNKVTVSNKAASTLKDKPESVVEIKANKTKLPLNQTSSIQSNRRTSICDNKDVKDETKSTHFSTKEKQQPFPPNFIKLGDYKKSLEARKNLPVPEVKMSALPIHKPGAIKSRRNTYSDRNDVVLIKLFGSDLRDLEDDQPNTNEEEIKPRTKRKSDCKDNGNETPSKKKKDDEQPTIDVANLTPFKKKNDDVSAPRRGRKPSAKNEEEKPKTRGKIVEEKGPKSAKKIDRRRKTVPAGTARRTRSRSKIVTKQATVSLIEDTYMCSPLSPHSFKLVHINFTYNLDECSNIVENCVLPEIGDEPEVIPLKLLQLHNRRTIVNTNQEIPTIDLTEDNIKKEIKEEVNDAGTNHTIKVLSDTEDKGMEDECDIANAHNLKNTVDQGEMITLYRSDETVNNSLDVQATVASIAPSTIKSTLPSPIEAEMLNSGTLQQDNSGRTSVPVGIINSKISSSAVSDSVGNRTPDNIQENRVEGLTRPEAEKLGVIQSVQATAKENTVLVSPGSISTEGSSGPKEISAPIMRQNVPMASDPKQASQNCTSNLAAQDFLEDSPDNQRQNLFRLQAMMTTLHSAILEKDAIERKLQNLKAQQEKLSSTGIDAQRSATQENNTYLRSLSADTPQTNNIYLRSLSADTPQRNANIPGAIKPNILGNVAENPQSILQGNVLTSFSSKVQPSVATNVRSLADVQPKISENVQRNTVQANVPASLSDKVQHNIQPNISLGVQPKIPRNKQTNAPHSGLPNVSGIVQTNISSVARHGSNNIEPVISGGILPNVSIKVKPNIPVQIQPKVHGQVQSNILSNSQPNALRSVPPILSGNVQRNISSSIQSCVQSTSINVQPPVSQHISSSVLPNISENLQPRTLRDRNLRQSNSPSTLGPPNCHCKTTNIPNNTQIHCDMNQVPQNDVNSSQNFNSYQRHQVPNDARNQDRQAINQRASQGTAAHYAGGPNMNLQNVPQQQDVNSEMPNLTSKEDDIFCQRVARMMLPYASIAVSHHRACHMYKSEMVKAVKSVEPFIVSHLKVFDEERAANLQVVARSVVKVLGCINVPSEPSMTIYQKILYSVISHLKINMPDLDFSTLYIALYKMMHPLEAELKGSTFSGGMIIYITYCINLLKLRQGGYSSRDYTRLKQQICAYIEIEKKQKAFWALHNKHIDSSEQAVTQRRLSSGNIVMDTVPQNSQNIVIHSNINLNPSYCSSGTVHKNLNNASVQQNVAPAPVPQIRVLQKEDINSRSIRHSNMPICREAHQTNPQSVVQSGTINSSSIYQNVASHNISTVADHRHDSNNAESYKIHLPLNAPRCSVIHSPIQNISCANNPVTVASSLQNIHCANNPGAVASSLDNQVLRNGDETSNYIGQYQNFLVKSGDNQIARSTNRPLSMPSMDSLVQETPSDVEHNCGSINRTYLSAPPHIENTSTEITPFTSSQVSPEHSLSVGTQVSINSGQTTEGVPIVEPKTEIEDTVAPRENPSSNLDVIDLTDSEQSPLVIKNEPSDEAVNKKNKKGEAEVLDVIVIDENVKIEMKKEIDFLNVDEVIDLTWLDGVDPARLECEMSSLPVKQEPPTEEEPDQEQHLREISAFSPADSGIASDGGFVTPPIQNEFPEQVFSDRRCICGKTSEYVCACRSAMYCSEECQKSHWPTHKALCLKYKRGNMQM